MNENSDTARESKRAQLPKLIDTPIQNFNKRNNHISLATNVSPIQPRQAN